MTLDLARPAIAGPGRLAGAVRRLRTPAALIGLGTVGFWILAALLAPVVAPYPPNDFVGPALQPPSAAFLLGTDDLGRDVLTRVLWGARPVLILAPLAVLIAEAVGALIGLFSGYAGQVADAVEERQHELVDRRETERDLGLHPGNPRAREILCVRDCGVEQRRLADPGRPAQDEHATRAATRAVQKTVDRGALSLAIYEHRGDRSRQSTRSPGPPRPSLGGATDAARAVGYGTITRSFTTV